MSKKFWLATIFGAAAGAWYMLVARPRMLRWGLDEDEKNRALPGDDLVPQPIYESTRAITVRAPASQVWPWIVQIGVGRGGFYTYDALENLAGLGIHSAERIHPEWQSLHEGDSISISSVTPLRVRVMEPNRAMVLHAVMDPTSGVALDPDAPRPSAYIDWTWAFVLEEVAPQITRLIIRVRADHRPVAFKYIAPIVLEPVHFIMESGMLQGIKRRAEEPKQEPIELNLHDRP
jgi:hypothetical protein